jgi:NADH-quinone oxidoreductase subunit L
LGALVGLPPLAGFWSKDAILHAASGQDGWVAALVFGSGLATVVVTAWYATRLWLRTFLGARRAGSPDAAPARHAAAEGVPARHAAAHDPPGAMLWPVVALAVPSALLGLAAFADALPSALRTPEPAAWTGEYRPGAPVPQPVTGEETLVHIGVFMVVPLLAVALGVAGAWLLWRRDTAADPARALGRLRPVLARGFYLDEVQSALVVRPAYALARAVRRGDESVVDGAVEGTGRGAVSLGGLLARAHRAGLPRAATAVLAGVLLAGAAAVLLGGGS